MNTKTIEEIKKMFQNETAERLAIWSVNFIKKTKTVLPEINALGIRVYKKSYENIIIFVRFSEDGTYKFIEEPDPEMMIFERALEF